MAERLEGLPSRVREYREFDDGRVLVLQRYRGAASRADWNSRTCERWARPFLDPRGQGHEARGVLGSGQRARRPLPRSGGRLAVI